MGLTDAMLMLNGGWLPMRVSYNEDGLHVVYNGEEYVSGLQLGEGWVQVWDGSLGLVLALGQAARSMRLTK